jgi:hypothetical protein
MARIFFATEHTEGTEKGLKVVKPVFVSLCVLGDLCG